MQTVQDVYEFLRKYYVDEVDPHILYKGALEGMINSLQDPYTTFVESDSISGVNLQDTTKGFFGGIGVVISKSRTSTPGKPAYVEVTAAIEDTPSWKGGIRPRDLIVKIGTMSTDTMTMDEVLKKLRGPIGTKVTLVVKRGTKIFRPFTLTRAKIEIPTVKYAKIDPNIAYVRLIEFNPVTATRMVETVTELRRQGCDRLILDLLNNPGGLITAAVDVTSSFIPSGTVVTTKSRVQGHSITFSVNARAQKLPPSMPVIVLINRDSASASEIVSGALKDHKRAYLVGQTTYGKGVVQQVFDLNERESLKMTISRYYTPSDANIDKSGIPPDLEVRETEFTPEEEEALVSLFKSEKVKLFAEQNRTMNSERIKQYARGLAREFKLRSILVEKLIAQEYHRHNASFVYDLEYDEQLRKAVELIRTQDIHALVARTKTVKELQEGIQEKKKVS